MNPFFAWLIKSTVSLALLYILFRLAMRNDKTHSLNRFLLLAILLLATVIPFLDFQFFYEEVPLKQVEVFREFVSTPSLTNDVTMPEVQSVQKASSFSINPFLALYIIAILVLLVRLMVSVIRVMQIIGQAEKRKISKIVLAIVKDLIQPFTFFNKIILSEKDFNENKDIVVAHEHAHIKQMHAIDLVVCELFTVVHFFNPLMWLLRRDLKLVHEYQADQAVLNKGIDAKKYQLLVLEKSVGERRFAMANHFTQKPILKRIKMMHKKNKKQWTWVKTILFIPALILLLQAFSRPESLFLKANELVPSLIQSDSSEVWIDNWINYILINGTMGTKVDYESHTNTGKVVQVISFNSTLSVLQNQKSELLVDNNRLELAQLKEVVNSFLHGKKKNSKTEVDSEITNFKYIGSTKIYKGKIIFRYDIATPKSSIRDVLEIVGEAYLNVRKEAAREKFGEDYFVLAPDKKDIINQCIPVNFSIVEPKVTNSSFNSTKGKNTLAPPPPKVIGIIPQKGKIPFITFHDTWINVNGESCEFERMNEILEKALPVDGTQRQVELIVNSETSKDRLEQVYNELERINDLEIIKKMAPPPPPPKFVLELYKDKVTMWDEVISMEEVSKRARDFLNIVGDKKYYAQVYFEKGLPKDRIGEEKTDLFMVGMKNVKIEEMK